VELELSLKKSLEENAGDYFEKSKRAKKKLEGARAALKKSLEQLEVLKQKSVLEAQQQGKIPKRVKREWFEKFRWFFSSTGKLVILGRDATTNEILIKKYTQPRDRVFHCEGLKSPFCVVKLENQELDEATKREAAIATASFSEAWRTGIAECEVFIVKPEQVSKRAQAGEYLAKGAFMIYGKKESATAPVELGVGLTSQGKVMCAPLTALSAHCKKYVQIYPGKGKASDVAKRLQKELGGGDLDEYIRCMPSGGVSLK